MQQPNWKALHQRSLQQNQPEHLRELMSSGTLNQVLQEVAEEAQEMFEYLTKQLRKSNPSWTQDQAERSAQEVVLAELVLVKDAETQEADRQGGYTD